MFYTGSQKEAILYRNLIINYRIIYDSVDKVDTAVNTVEYVVETIESVATKFDNVIDSITDDLPEDSKLRKTMVAFDELVEGVAKGAHIANDIIDKV